MRSTIHQLFYHGIWWNTLEAIPYQLILSIHQVAVFSVVGASVYGVMGTIFSLIFLVVGITNLGFDAFLPTFYASALKSRRSCKHFLTIHYAPTLIALLSASLCVAMMLPHTMTPIMMFIIPLLIIVEGLKKTFRALLHGAFYNKHTAIIELIQIVSYVFFVWGLYGIGVPLTVELVFGLLLVVSTLCTCLLGYSCYHLYLFLPEILHQPVAPTFQLSELIRQRCYTTLTSLGHQFFSSNALVPLVAYHFGMTSAGTLKIVGTVAHSITFTIHKIFGSAGDALFAHTKESKPVDKQQAFFLITHHLYASLYGSLLFGIGAFFWLYASSRSLQEEGLSTCALLFLVIHISEQFFTVYERFFITENCAWELMIFNGCTLGCLAAVILFASMPSPVILLRNVLYVRFFSFILISSISFIWWRIRPSLRIHTLCFVYSFVATITCFLIQLKFR